MKITILSLVLLASGVAEANFLTRDDIAAILVDSYGYSHSETNSILKRLEKPNSEDILPISGVITTSGRNAILPWKRTSLWKNVWVTFKDNETDRIISTNCLFDVSMTNGGLGYSVDYRQIAMFIVGQESAANLDGAIFGTGMGGTWTAGLGFEVNLLPAHNTKNSMILVSGQVGLGLAITFPTVQFLRTQSCPE